MGAGQIVGIDLGTTNSAVGIWRDGRAQLIPNSLGHSLTPSAVGLSDQGELLVGLAARERQTTHPQLTATVFKRYMGTQRTVRLGERSYLPEELSALVLRSLKADAEAFLGQPVGEAVITVPAYFNDKQRQATRRAGELAGLKVQRLLNEPTAAALAYGIHELEGEDRRFLVFDLGGGTFDVSILEIFEGVIEVRSSTGDNRLGGEDFNELLMGLMRKRLPAALAAKARDGALYQALREAAERARRELTAKPEALMSVAWDGEAYECEVTAEGFETLCEPLLERLRTPVLRALRDSNLMAEGLREIVLVGGATRMPVVRRAVTKMFGRFPSATVNPDEAVALGAAVQAGLKARDAALTEVVLTDVAPFSLGIEVSEFGAAGGLRSGLFAPIIERNTTVPVSRIETFKTLQDYQSVIDVQIYQGESRQVSENVFLGEIKVPLPRKPAGEVAIEVRFSYDINGLLEVDIHIPATGESFQKVIIESEGGQMEDLEARRKALAELKVHPRDLDANAAALARAHRCYEAQLGQGRDHIAQLITQFEDVLDRQNPKAAERARGELTAALDALEGETWL